MSRSMSQEVNSLVKSTVNKCNLKSVSNESITQLAFLVCKKLDLFRAQDQYLDNDTFGQCHTNLSNISNLVLCNYVYLSVLLPSDHKTLRFSNFL